MDSFFSHVLQGLIVRADDRRDRRPDDSGKVGINRFGSLAEFIDQAVVAAEDGVHIAQAGTEDGTLFPTEPARFIETADVAGTAAGIANDDDAVQSVEDGRRAGVVRCKG